MSQEEPKPSLLEYAVKELKQENDRLKDEIDLISKTEIEKKEELLNLQSAALEAAANGIVITDCEGKITWVNDSFTKLSGYSKIEVYNQYPSLLRSGFHSENFYRGLWETISGGNIWMGELVNKKKDGSFYNEEMTITPVKNNKEEITAYIAIKQDITERKKDEHNLLINQISVERSGLGIIWVNTDSEIIYANNAILDNLGYSRMEILNIKVADLDPKWPDKDFFDSKLEALRDKKTLKFESENRKKDGSLFPVEVVLNLVEYDNEEIIVAYLQDISEQKAVREIEQLLITSKNLDDLLGGMHNSISKVLDAPNCYVALLDDYSNTVSFPYFQDEMDPKPEPRDTKKGMTEYVINSGRAIRITPEKFRTLVREQKIDPIGTPPLSWLGVPLFIESEPAGALVLQSYEENLQYTDVDLNWLFSIASLVSTAIERRNAELKIKENEEKFKSVTNSTNDAITTITEEREIILWNKAAEKLWGYTEEEVLGKEINLLITPDRFLGEATERAEKISSLGKDFKGTFEIITKKKDGSEFETELSVSQTEINDVWYTTGV